MSDQIDLSKKRNRIVLALDIFLGPAVASMIQSGVLSDIEAGLKEAGIVAQEASLVDAKLIDDTYFMVKLG